MTQAITGITSVLNNPKYPAFIQNHAIFKIRNKIKKIFPSIGLSNSEEETNYSNLEDNRNIAYELLIALSQHTGNKWQSSANIITPDKTAIRQLVADFCNHLHSYHTYCVVAENDKLSFKFYYDIGTWEGKFFAQKGESILKSYQKLLTLCQERGIALSPLDSFEAFKKFSALNSGGLCKLIFSSNGEKGLWDIATISMRGIKSCQTWGTTQAFGLIGSMSSRYVGVIYLTSGTQTDHGSRMMRRSMVRYAISNITKKPALLLDRVYPQDDPSARELFKKFLEKKSKLPVLFSNDGNWGQYQLPREDKLWERGAFKPGEYSYMDTKIAYFPKINKQTPNISELKSQIENDFINFDRQLFTNVQNNVVKIFDEYCLDGTSHAALMKGGVANLINSIRNNSSIGAVMNTFLPNLRARFLNGTVDMPNLTQFVDSRSYELAAIRSIMIHRNEHQKNMLNAALGWGSWTKAYPQSMIKFLDMVFCEYKKEVIKIYQSLAHG